MTSPPIRRRPPGRYDEPSRLGGRATAVVLGTCFVALLLAVVWVLFDRYGQPDVRSRLLGYSVQGDRGVVVEFEVAAEQGKAVTCVVRARNAAGAEVGREVVRVGAVPPGERTLTVRHALATTDRPVTGEVQRCVLDAGAGSPSP